MNELEAEIEVLSKLRHRHLMTLLGHCIEGNEKLLQRFINRDLKPSNILLGDDTRAKVGDFGLVKIIAPRGNGYVWIQVAGTFGCLEYEYVATGRVMRKVNVYAFGVVLMELISVRKALDSSLSEEMPHLASCESMENICKVAELTARCTAPKLHKRPNMWHAVNVLVPLVEQWNPTCTHEQHEEEGCDVIYEGHYDMSFSEILSDR
ncbi:hypothetical protein V8G54_026398 [Vigna mungo]|uniref:Protein kinase domain-containing protein n=1 Tax=Vigna mungo TaxID=3915 RepID=A0AAQ3N009_VIGMU